jgi:hypothetical protein
MLPRCRFAPNAAVHEDRNGYLEPPQETRLTHIGSADGIVDRALWCRKRYARLAARSHASRGWPQARPGAFEGRGQIRPRCRMSGKRTATSAAIVGRPRPADRDERTQAIADARSEQRDKLIDRMIQAAKACSAAACSARAKLRSRYYAREFDREPSRFRDACPWISVGDRESHSQPRSRGGPRHRTSRPSRRSAASPRLDHQDREPCWSQPSRHGDSGGTRPTITTSTSVSMSSFRSQKWLGFIICAVVRSFRPSRDGAANRRAVVLARKPVVPGGRVRVFGRPAVKSDSTGGFHVLFQHPH